MKASLKAPCPALAPLAVTLVALLAVGGASAQSPAQPSVQSTVPSPGRIFRCGNTYTNDPVQGQAAGCRALEGGRVTVVEGTRVQAPPSPLAALSPAGAGPAAARVESREQQARDAQAREILEEELRRAQSRQAELLREYNNGEPEKLGPETRNHQKYLDRIEQLKAGIARNDADIQGIRRELARLGASK